MTDSKPRTIGVIGAGQMGRGIAQVVAEAGLRVKLADLSLDTAMEGKARIEKTFANLVEKGKRTRAEADEQLARITPIPSLGEMAGVELTVEAVSENLELKRDIFEELDRVCDDRTVLASNTSSISITTLAAATRKPGRVVGMHFMNPVPLMKLVEVIRGLETTDAAYQSVVSLAKLLGKEVITSKDVPGFIVNRVLMPLINEACFALAEGLASAKDIDTGCKLGLHHPMGPLELADLIGLDTCLAIMEVLHKELGEDKYRPSPLLRQYVAAGRLGRKTGRGFHSHS